MTLGYIGLALSIVVLVVLIIEDVNIWIACLASTIILALTSSGDVTVPGMIGTWLTSAGSMFSGYFVLYLCGGIFARVMEETHSAIAISKALIKIFPKKYLLFTMPIIGGILQYCGISVWLCLYALIPIALSLMEEADIPRRFLPIFLLAGTITVGQVAPGTPAMQNLIPMQILQGMGYDVNASSGMVIGWITVVGMLISALWILNILVNRARRHGEIFERKVSDGVEPEFEYLPPMWKALIGPICAIIFVNVQILSDASYNILLGGVVACIVNFNHMDWSFSNIKKHLEAAVGSTLNLLLTMSAVIGLGSVVKATPAFTSIINAIVNINAGPAVSLAIAVNIVAGISSSASGGEAIVVPMLGQTYIDMGLTPAAVHRITALSCIGLDSLPQNGAINAALKVCDETHKTAYWPIFWLTVVVPVVWCFVAALLFTWFPGLP